MNQTAKLKSNYMQKHGITWEVTANGNDIIIDSIATDTMRVIHNGFENLQDEVQDNLPAGARHTTTIQKISEIAHEMLTEYAIEHFDRSVVVIH